MGASSTPGVTPMRIPALLLALVAPLVAHAVNVSESGFGQALIYPYYTVQSVDGNAFNTYVTIVNGHSAPKALRVRFREGRKGIEVARFNLFLEARGMWAGAVVPSAGGARLLSPDPCTSPAFTADTTPFLEFSNAAFTGLNADGFGTGAERLREGYVEVLEMASFDEALTRCQDLQTDHVPAAQTPRGYLYGTLTLINVASGLDFTVAAEALDNLATRAFYRPIADPYPDFDAAEIGATASFVRDGKVYRVSTPSGLMAVEAALVRFSMQNEVVLDAITQSATDWVVTMPTRRFHRAGRESPWFGAPEWSGEDPYLTGLYRSRSGTQATLVRDCGSSACPAQTHPVSIRTRWSATVLGFSAGSAASSSEDFTSNALGALNTVRVVLPTLPGTGSLELAFGSADRFPYLGLDATTLRLADGAVATERILLTGLPVTGFMARTFRNGTLSCGAGACQGNYGGSVPHRFRRAIDPFSPAP